MHALHNVHAHMFTVHSIMYYTVQFAIKNESTIINLYVLSMVWLVDGSVYSYSDDTCTYNVHVHLHAVL